MITCLDAPRNSTQPKVHSVITETRLFDHLTPEQREELFDNAVRRRYSRDAVIFTPGDQGTVIYYIVNGRVKIYDMTSDGREIIYRVCVSRNWFGVSAIFGGKTRPTFAQAQAETEVLMIDRANFEQFIHENPKFSVVVIHLLGQRLRQAHSAIAEFMVGDVQSRVAQLLLKFAETESTTRDGVVTIENRFTHQEIANMIGATRTTVTKVINIWKRRNIVHIARGRILIRNYEELTKLIRH